MNYARRFGSAFDAAHQVEGVEGHQRVHGHTFYVTATVTGPLDTEEGGVRRVARSTGIQEKLDAICAELDGRDLNAMMTGSLPVPEIIAAWILERLPDVEAVEVEMGWRKENGWAQRVRR